VRLDPEEQEGQPDQGHPRGEEQKPAASGRRSQPPAVFAVRAGRSCQRAVHSVSRPLRSQRLYRFIGAKAKEEGRVASGADL
jgi:hypothetical protein